jgi:hypothetical protein
LAHYRFWRATTASGASGVPDSVRTVPTLNILTPDLQPMRHLISTEVRHIMCKATLSH